MEIHKIVDALFVILLIIITVITDVTAFILDVYHLLLLLTQSVNVDAQVSCREDICVQNGKRLRSKHSRKTYKIIRKPARIVFLIVYFQ